MPCKRRSGLTGRSTGSWYLSSNSRGNQGLLGQYGITATISAFSDQSLQRNLWNWKECIQSAEPPLIHQCIYSEGTDPLCRIYPTFVAWGGEQIYLRDYSQVEDSLKDKSGCRDHRKSAWEF